MTSAPLTPDEEAFLRKHVDDSPTWAYEQIHRLLATLDEARAGQCQDVRCTGCGRALAVQASQCPSIACGGGA